MRNALTTCDLSKKYGKTWALRNCSLSIPAGRIAGIIGPNGAGKSTLLNIAVGLLPPTSGKVELFGSDPYSDPLALRRAGFDGQDRPLYRDFTVAETLRFGAEMNPRWNQAMAESRMRRLGIPLDRKVKALSGGQQAQVSLVLALARNAELIILDEPVASLDPLARREFMQTLMEEVVEDGLTVVFSSHLVNELERICDYLVILNHGRIHYAGDLEEFVQTHRLLVGPRVGDVELGALHNVIHASHTERQSSVLVKANGHLIDPRWDVRDPGFEETVLAYLARQEAITEAAR